MMLEDWSRGPDRPKKLDLSRPLIGLAVCVSGFVASFMVFFYAQCGPGTNGYNESGTTTPAASVAFFFVSTFIVGGFGCFVWFLAALIMNSNRE